MDKPHEASIITIVANEVPGFINWNFLIPGCPKWYKIEIANIINVKIPMKLIWLYVVILQKNPDLSKFNHKLIEERIRIQISLAIFIQDIWKFLAKKNLGFFFFLKCFF